MSIQLTPAKAAILLGTSDRTVRSLIRRGILPATPVGSRSGVRQGPARYEIALKDLNNSGLPVDLGRLPLLATLNRDANVQEQEQVSQQAETTLLQALRDEFARLRVLREGLEQTLEEWSERCARLDAWEARLALSTTQAQQELLPPQQALPSTSHPATALVEGPPSGLTPLWIEGLGARIRYNARRHLLLVDTSIVTLTPTEFRLVIEVLTRYAQWQVTRQAGCSVVDRATLQQTMGQASHRHVAWHLANANAKLAPFGMRVQAITGSGYYTLIVEHASTPSRAACPAQHMPG